MHVWIVEVKDDKESNWRAWANYDSRSDAREANIFWSELFYKTRVVKYISSKGE